jgi:hypothetical protein
LFAPKVTLFVGQVAVIQDTVARPFVVAVKSPESGPKQVESLEQVIHSVEEGTRIDLQSYVEEDSVRVNCRVRLTKLDDVKTSSFKLGEHQDVVTIQMPEVSTQVFGLDAEVADGQALLISPLRSNDDARMLYIAIRPRLLPETDAAFLGW